MKLHITFDFKRHPAGGGNQFLLTLRKYFRRRGIYSDKYESADIILFNSYQYILKVAKLKLKYSNKVFVHRVDGPIKLYNVSTDKRDCMTNIANRIIADGTIFQSNWSRGKNYRLGLNKNKFETVIMNAPDPEFFNMKHKKKFNKKGKIRLIATSWSSNWNKGFKIYKWLDENLDFKKYEMVFIGNSPIKFKNIKYKEPIPKEALAKELKKSDIFITASKNDPCSNSLIEALHCGLPVIVLNSGGHPEIIGNAGEVFDSPEEIPMLLRKIITSYNIYRKNIKLSVIDDIGKKYEKFMINILKKVKEKKYTPKKLNIFKLVIILFVLFYWKLNEKLNLYKDRIFYDKK